MKKLLSKKILRQGLCLLILIVFSFSLFTMLAPVVKAQAPAADSPAAAGGTPLTTLINESLTATGTAIHGGTAPTKTLPQIVGGVINSVLGILGTVAVVLVIYAGVLWMTAGGNEEQIKKAKGILTQAVIGLAIILLAYTITQFAVKALTTGTTGT